MGIFIDSASSFTHSYETMQIIRDSADKGTASGADKEAAATVGEGDEATEDDTIEEGSAPPWPDAGAEDVVAARGP